MENSNDIKTIDEELISSEIRTIEYITVSDVDDVRLNSLVHIPTVLLSDDVPLKLAVLKALSRERLVSEAAKTQVFENFSEKLYNTKYDLRRCKKELESLQALRSDQYNSFTTRHNKMELDLAEAKSTIEFLQLRNDHLEGLNMPKDPEEKLDTKVSGKKRSWFSRIFW